jgi:hypothetical protein
MRTIITTDGVGFPPTSNITKSRGLIVQIWVCCAIETDSYTAQFAFWKVRPLWH